MIPLSTLCCFLKEPSKNFFISIQFISRTIWILPGFNLIGSKLIVVDECIAPVIGGITNSLKQQQPCQFSHLFSKKLQTLKSNLELFSSILIIITQKSGGDFNCGYNDELVSIFLIYLELFDHFFLRFIFGVWHLIFLLAKNLIE